MILNLLTRILTADFHFLLNPKHKMTITQIHGKDSVIESRNYFGFSSILGNDSVYINENTSLDHIGGVINFYSKWNHWYNSNLSISSYEIKSNYIAEQFSLVNTNKDTIGSIDEKNRFSDRRIKFLINSTFGTTTRYQLDLKKHVVLIFQYHQ